MPKKKESKNLITKIKDKVVGEKAPDADEKKTDETQASEKPAKEVKASPKKKATKRTKENKNLIKRDGYSIHFIKNDIHQESKLDELNKDSKAFQTVHLDYNQDGAIDEIAVFVAN